MIVHQPYQRTPGYYNRFGKQCLSSETSDFAYFFANIAGEFSLKISGLDIVDSSMFGAIRVFGLCRHARSYRTEEIKTLSLIKLVMELAVILLDSTLDYHGAK